MSDGMGIPPVDGSIKNFKEKLSVRWIALGAVIVLTVLLGSEKIVWSIVSSDTRAFFQNSLSEVSSGTITDERKQEIKSETIGRLLNVKVIGLFVMVLISAVAAGFVAMNRSSSIWSGFISSSGGTLVAFIISGALSISAITAVLMFGALGLSGAFINKKIIKNRK